VLLNGGSRSKLLSRHILVEYIEQQTNICNINLVFCYNKKLKQIKQYIIDCGIKIKLIALAVVFSAMKHVVFTTARLLGDKRGILLYLTDKN